MFTLRTTLRRRTGRVTAAGLVVLIGLLLSACSARGSGQLAQGLVDGVPINFLGRANFSFDLTCGIVNGKPKIGGKIRYYDEGAALSLDTGLPLFNKVSFEGTLTELNILDENGAPVIYNPDTCETAELTNPFPGQAAQFLGTYKSGHKSGNFVLLVFEDEGAEPDPALEITGDYFSIELPNGPHMGYTRAGYIECGTIEVRNEAHN